MVRAVNLETTASGTFFNISQGIMDSIQLNASITTLSVSPLSVCPGDSVDIQFSITGPFRWNNVFTAELSDATGSFATPVSMGTLAGNTPVTLRLAIPFGTPAGTQYRIRMNGSLPSVVLGTDNGQDIDVQGAPVAPTPSNNGPICPGDTLILSSNVSGNLFYWSGPNGFTSSVNNPQIQNVNSTHAGIYTLMYKSGICFSAPGTTTVLFNVPVAITASSNSPICAGTAMNLSAPAIGNAPTYQWQVNGVNVGVNSNTFSSATLINGDIVTCILTSNDPCANPITATSNPIVMVVNPILAPTINIVAFPAGPICSGTNVTFTANITNGGAAPVYQWQINGINVGGNSNTFSSATLNNGDLVTCNLTSNAICVSPSNITSNNIFLTVIPTVVPTVNIVALPAGPICAGTNVDFTANITNGGAAPIFQWQVNGINTGVNSSTFNSSGLNNGDIVSVILTSNAPCANPINVSSNNIAMVVNPLVTPTINIISNPGMPICAGSNVDFTANITNGGIAPIYQWLVNGVNVGANSNTYSTNALNPGDIVSCTLVSNANCLTTANALSNNIVISNLKILSNSD
jgi:hypothetical protein